MNIKQNLASENAVEFQSNKAIKKLKMNKNLQFSSARGKRELDR